MRTRKPRSKTKMVEFPTHKEHGVKSAVQCGLPCVFYPKDENGNIIHDNPYAEIRPGFSYGTIGYYKRNEHDGWTVMVIRWGVAIVEHIPSRKEAAFLAHYFEEHAILEKMSVIGRAIYQDAMNAWKAYTNE